jgi:DNA-binding NarL/FixJ family response regulator
VDDHKLVRKGLASILKDKWDICGEAEDGKEAIDKVLELGPDLVLLDLSMPVMSGTTAARHIRHLSPATRIILLSMHDSETVTELARLTGADACLSKRCATKELTDAISAVLGRLRPVRPPIRIKQKLEKRFRSGFSTPPDLQLYLTGGSKESSTSGTLWKPWIVLHGEKLFISPNCFYGVNDLGRFRFRDLAVDL